MGPSVRLALSALAQCHWSTSFNANSPDGRSAISPNNAAFANKTFMSYVNVKLLHLMLCEEDRLWLLSGNESADRRSPQTLQPLCTSTFTVRPANACPPILIQSCQEQTTSTPLPLLPPNAQFLWLPLSLGNRSKLSGYGLVRGLTCTHP